MMTSMQSGISEGVTHDAKRLPLPSPNSWPDLLLRVYGPYLFGVVSLLVVWNYIVAPQMERNRVDTTAMQAIATSNATTAQAIEQSARILREATGTLDQTAKALTESVNELRAMKRSDNERRGTPNG